VLETLFDVKSLAHARYLHQNHIGDRLITVDEFEHLFKLLGALWIYQGDPRPEVFHAVTREGKCTNGFINCGAVLEYANLCEIMAIQLVRRLTEQYHGDVDLVIDAAYSGTDLGQNVALHGPSSCNARHRTVEKDENGNPTKFRGTIAEDERILLVNELMTTAGGSAQMAKNAVISAGAKPEQFVPFALILVNRSKEAETLADGTPVISVARYHLETFEPGPETCPYCAAGSQAVKPKVGNNWQLYFSC